MLTQTIASLELLAKNRAMTCEDSDKIIKQKKIELKGAVENLGQENKKKKMSCWCTYLYYV